VVDKRWHQEGNLVWHREGCREDHVRPPLFAPRFVVGQDEDGADSQSSSHQFEPPYCTIQPLHHTTFRLTRDTTKISIVRVRDRTTSAQRLSLDSLRILGSLQNYRHHAGYARFAPAEFRGDIRPSRELFGDRGEFKQVRGWVDHCQSQQIYPTGPPAKAMPTLTNPLV
jgi:hypothetical protein